MCRHLDAMQIVARYKALANIEGASKF